MAKKSNLVNWTFCSRRSWQYNSLKCNCAFEAKIWFYTTSRQLWSSANSAQVCHLSTCSFTANVISLTLLQHSGTHSQEKIWLSPSAVSFKSPHKTHHFPTWYRCVCVWWAGCICLTQCVCHGYEFCHCNLFFLKTFRAAVFIYLKSLQPVLSCVN